MEFYSWLKKTYDWAEKTLVSEYLTSWTPAQVPNLEGKVAVVTGGNSGLGYVTCRKLAENGAKVFLVSRDRKNGEKAAAQIRSDIGPSALVTVLECDMSHLRNVQQLVKDIQASTTKLDILVNMAGVFHPGPFAKTVDGLEQTIGIDYYAPALLTLGLLDLLRATPGSRVVFMASSAEQFGRLDWDNLKGDKYNDSGMTPYGTVSKQAIDFSQGCTLPCPCPCHCHVPSLLLLLLLLTGLLSLLVLVLWSRLQAKAYNLMFARELATRIPDVDFLGVHPGVVLTPLMVKGSVRYLTFIGAAIGAVVWGLPADRGAWSTIYTATDPQLKGRHWTFIGPNFMNFYNTVERKPVNYAVHNPVSCWKLFEETVFILKELGCGSTINQIPRHPDDVYGSTTRPQAAAPTAVAA